MKSSRCLVLIIASMGLSSACGEPFVTSTDSTATASGSGAGGAMAGTGGAMAGTGGAMAGTGGAMAGTGGGVQTSCVCVPAFPTGWVGAWLDQSGSPPPCPAELPTQIDLFKLLELKAPPAGCACACGDPVGVGCTTHLRCDPDATQCAAAGNMNGQGTTCGTNIPNVNFPAFCRADPPSAFGGACTSGAASSVVPWSWKPATRACGTQAGGACGDPGSTCVPKLAGGIGPCVAQAGDLACPAPYAKKTVYFDGKTVADNRGCDATACGCGAPIGSGCPCGANGCAIDLYGDGACGALQASVPTNSTCGAVQNKPAGIKIVGATLVAGTCPPSGASQPKGAAIPTAPLTVCCVP